MTREGIGQVLAVLAEEFGVEFTETRTAIWVAALADLSDQEGLRALALHVRRSRFAPHPADLIATVRGDAKDAEALLDEEAELAVRHMEARLDDWRAVDLGPELNATVRLMGGPDAVLAQMMRPDDWQFRRQEARRIYKAFRRRGVGEEEGRPAFPRTVLESLNADPAAWRGEIPQEEWRAGLLPEAAPFLPAGTGLVKRA